MRTKDEQKLKPLVWPPKCSALPVIFRNHLPKNRPYSEAKAKRGLLRTVRRTLAFSLNINKKTAYQKQVNGGRAKNASQRSRAEAGHI